MVLALMQMGFAQQTPIINVMHAILISASSIPLLLSVEIWIIPTVKMKMVVFYSKF